MYMSVWVVLTVFANICLWNGCLFNCWLPKSMFECVFLYIKCILYYYICIPHNATNIVGASDNIIIILQQFTAIGMCNVHLLFNVQLTSKDTNRSTPLVFIKRPLCFKQTAINMECLWFPPHFTFWFTPLIIILLSTGWMTYLFNRMIIFSTFSICVIISLTCPKCVFAAINQNHMQCTMHLNFVLFNRTSGFNHTDTEAGKIHSINVVNLYVQCVVALWIR